MIPNPTEALLIDARGMRCPWPVLRAARALRQAREIILVADDPLAPAELAAFAKERALSLTELQTPLGSGLHLAPYRMER
jgi:tRNA 2-thiouridine synthesizing protein A